MKQSFLCGLAAKYNFSSPPHFSRASFTLIELLITIGIISILSLLVILILNPQELLKQTRDNTRLSDLATINTALTLFQTDTGGSGSMGNGSTTYVSIPDASSTCANLGLPALPPGYSYACSSTSNYRNINGTGWIPVNFTQLSFTSPFGVLPVDPINTTSSGNYYTYTPGGSWELTSIPESSKYRQHTPILPYPSQG